MRVRDRVSGSRRRADTRRWKLRASADGAVISVAAIIAPTVSRAPRAAARAARASASAKRATCARPRCTRRIRPLCSTISTNPAAPPAPTPTSASAATATAAKRSLGKEPARLAAPKVKLDRVTAPGTPVSFRQLERLTAFHPTEAPRQARHRPATAGRPAHCLGARMNAAPSG
jgi:hypothetical protein